MPIAVVGVDILGNGAKITSSIAECLLPVFTTLLCTFHDK
jgi:hypothetical protein